MTRRNSNYGKARHAACVLLWLIAVALLSFMPAPVLAIDSLPVPRDLREEARLVQRAGKPLVILFSMPNCAYCPDVRDNYLAPMIRQSGPTPGPVIREIDITSTTALIGFDGEALTQSDFAKRYRVRATPTVVMLDARGTALTQPLVGAGMAGFYGAYLDRALDEAQKALEKKRPQTALLGRR